MKFPTVINCCSCISLRAAGLVLGVVGVLGNMIGVLSGHYMVLNVVGLFIHSWWVYGILKENPKLMLPALISSFGIIVLLFFSPLFAIIYYYSEQTDDKKENNRLAYFCTAGSLILYCIAVLGIYLWIVIYSLYKSTKAATSCGRNLNVQVHLPTNEM